MNKKYIWIGAIAIIGLLFAYRLLFPDPKLEQAYQEKMAEKSKTIGEWQLSATNALSATNYKLQNEGDSTFMKSTFDDKSSGKEAVILTKYEDRTKISYQNQTHNNEYFVIESDGDLGLYNAENKMFGLAKKVK